MEQLQPIPGLGHAARRVIPRLAPRVSDDDQRYILSTAKECDGLRFRAGVHATEGDGIAVDAFGVFLREYTNGNARNGHDLQRGIHSAQKEYATAVHYTQEILKGCHWIQSHGVPQERFWPYIKEVENFGIGVVCAYRGLNKLEDALNVNGDFRFLRTDSVDSLLSVERHVGQAAGFFDASVGLERFMTSEGVPRFALQYLKYIIAREIEQRGIEMPQETELPQNTNTEPPKIVYVLLAPLAADNGSLSPVLPSNDSILYSLNPQQISGLIELLVSSDPFINKNETYVLLDVGVKSPKNIAPPVRVYEVPYKIVSSAGEHGQTPSGSADNERGLGAVPTYNLDVDPLTPPRNIYGQRQE